MHSFSYDGIDLGGVTYGVTLTRATLPLLTDPRVDVQTLAGEDGAVSQGTTFGAMQVSLDCIVEGFGRDDLDVKLRNIRDLFVTCQSGEKRLELDHWPGRYWDVRLVSGIDPEMKLNYARFSLDFVAPKPWATGTAEHSGLSGISNDTEFAVVNAGDIATNCEWIIKNTGVETGEVSVYNATRGELVVMTVGVADGSWLRLRSAGYSVQLSVNEGANWSSVNGVTGRVPRLAPGQNLLTVYGLTVGTIEWSFYERYR